MMPPWPRASREFACLVVRQSDRLPGDGWWVSEAERLGYQGLWTGPAAVKFIRKRRELVFDYWAGPEKGKEDAEEPQARREACACRAKAASSR